jgi:hypothetical protein
MKKKKSRRPRGRFETFTRITLLYCIRGVVLDLARFATEEKIDKDSHLLQGILANFSQTEFLPITFLLRMQVNQSITNF